MNYLIDLTEEDIRYVCSAIPYQETTSYFKRYPKEFAKLRPGFRVKSLTKEMVFRTLYEFRTRDFVLSYLIKHIDRWIKENLIGRNRNSGCYSRKIKRCSG